MERFGDVAAGRTLQRWLAQARDRAKAVHAPLAAAILDVFGGVDPTALLPAAPSGGGRVRALLKLGEVYRRLCWARLSERGEWTVGLFGLCNGRGWAPIWL